MYLWLHFLCLIAPIVAFPQVMSLNGEKNSCPDLPAYIKVAHTKGPNATPRIDGLKYFAFFVGYGRSGHSLCASLMDSNPAIAIANGQVEFGVPPDKDVTKHALRLVRSWLNRSVERAVRREKVAGYELLVEGQYNGLFLRLKVVGAKRGAGPYYLSGGLTQKDYLPEWRVTLANIERAANVMCTKVILFHVLRNPYDIISTQVMRKEDILYGAHFNAKNASLQNVDGQRIDPNGAFQKLSSGKHKWSEHYESQVHAWVSRHEQFERLRSLVIESSNTTLHNIFLEDVILKAESELRRWCKLLDLKHEDCSDEWIDSVKRTIFAEPHRAREHVVWPQHALELVNARLKEWKLDRYVWDGRDYAVQEDEKHDEE